MFEWGFTNNNQIEKNIIYVDCDASGNRSGSDWLNACIRIKDAVAKSAPGDEIWVAAGIYQEEYIRLKTGVEIIGGFAAIESNRKEANWNVNRTIINPPNPEWEESLLAAWFGMCQKRWNIIEDDQVFPWDGRESFVYALIPHLVQEKSGKKFEFYRDAALLASRPDLFETLLFDEEQRNEYKQATKSIDWIRFPDQHRIQSKKIRENLQSKQIIQTKPDTGATKIVNENILPPRNVPTILKGSDPVDALYRIGKKSNKNLSKGVREGKNWFMTVTYVNRKDKTYYLYQKETKTGKVRDFFSTKSDSEGTTVDTIPDGYEIYENPNAQVFLRKTPTQVFTDDEMNVIEQGIKRYAKLDYFKIDVRKNALVVFLPNQDVGSLKSFVNAFSGLSLNSQVEGIIQKKMTYSPIVKRQLFIPLPLPQL